MGRGYAGPRTGVTGRSLVFGFDLVHMTPDGAPGDTPTSVWEYEPTGARKVSSFAALHDMISKRDQLSDAHDKLIHHANREEGGLPEKVTIARCTGQPVYSLTTDRFEYRIRVNKIYQRKLEGSES